MRRKSTPFVLLQPSTKLLQMLPDSFVFVGEPQVNNSRNEGEEEEEEDWIDIGQFKVNIVTVSKKELESMRRYLP